MKYQINLLPTREVNFTDKIIYFSFNYLRYILVITQLVVIAVFFHRFQIDQQVVDLKDSIKQKSEIILASNSLLKEMKAMDIKMQSITKVTNEQIALQNMYDYFFSTFPEDLYLTSFDLNTSEIMIKGYTSNINTVRLYYNRLQKDKKFEVIKLDNIQRENLNYIFSFELKNFSGI